LVQVTPLRDWGARGCAALAAAVFLTLLFSLARLDPIPRVILAAVFALVPLSAVKPHAGLLVLATMTPFAAWMGRHWNGSVSWPETLVVAFCAGYCARRVVRRPGARDLLDAPWLLAVSLVVASLAVHFLIDAWRFGGSPTRAELWQLVTFGYFISAASSDPVGAAMRLIESLLLFRAAATMSRETPAFAPRLASWVVCGATAAAGLNLLRLCEGAARFEAPLGAFAHLFLTERVNVHYGDLNAAGSYFVMALFAAIGLTMRRKGLPWLISVLLIGCSVWMTGSRMAVMAGMLAMVLPAGGRAWRIRRGGVRNTTLAAATLLLALLAAVAAYAIPERGNQRSAVTAAHVRWELARTSLRMTASNPSFGVGIGRFYSRSGEFSSPELLESFPPAIHENAHNNFLQILAELGVVGFAVVMWLLWSAARYGRRLLSADLHEPLRWSLVTGLLAFVLSWLGGHPLLINEPAFAFWLLLGTVAGWGASLESPRGRVRLRAWVVPAATLFIAVSVPVRADRQKADFNLEHRGVGLSTWHDAIDGVRYRLAGSTSSVFLPTDAQMVVLPLRAAGTAADVRLELRLDGRPADIVIVPSDRWHYLRLALPRDRDAPRFRRLDLQVANPPPGEGSVLMIGKVEPK
jgi:O-antigen ligase